MTTKRSQQIMCYFNGIRVTRDEYIRLKDLEKSLADLEHLICPVQSAFDFHKSIIVRPTADKKDMELTPMEWGFLPSYVKNREETSKMRFGYRDENQTWHPPIDMQNAKGEELLLPRKVYRNAALKRRCLILSSGFEEWRHVPLIGKKGQPLKATEKIPYHVYLRGKKYFFIAGIWQPWTDKDTGEIVDTYSLVTTKANPVMKIIHNNKERMPTILTEDLAYEWIFGELTEERITEIATFQHPWEEMRAYTIAKTFKDDLEPLKPTFNQRAEPITIDGIRIDVPPPDPGGTIANRPQQVSLF